MPRLIDFEATGAVEKQLIVKHQQMVNKMPLIKYLDNKFITSNKL